MGHRLATHQEVETAFRKVFQHFGATTMARFSADFPNELARIENKKDVLSESQRVARHLVDFFGLPPASTFVGFSDKVSAGLVTLSNEDFYEIKLNSRYKNDKRDIPAILAHELTHVLLWRNKLWLDNDHENEVLTDTTCTLFGAGWMTLAAHRTEVRRGINEEVTSTNSLGYLTPQDLAWILVRRNTLLGRTEFPKEIAHWSGPIMGAKLELKYLSASYPFGPEGKLTGVQPGSKKGWLNDLFAKGKARKSTVSYSTVLPDPNDNTRIIFKCPICQQRLRLQIEKRGTLTCSVCKMCWEVNS